jgi:hypothetical protein
MITIQPLLDMVEITSAEDLHSQLKISLAKLIEKTDPRFWCEIKDWDSQESNNLIQG